MIRQVSWGCAIFDIQTNLAIVSNKGHAVTGIYRTTAEIAHSDSHIDRATT